MNTFTRLLSSTLTFVLVVMVGSATLITINEYGLKRQLPQPAKTDWGTQTHDGHQWIYTVTRTSSMYSNPDFEFAHHPDCPCLKPKPKPDREPNDLDLLFDSMQ